MHRLQDVSANSGFFLPVGSARGKPLSHLLAVCLPSLQEHFQMWATGIFFSPLGKLLFFVVFFCIQTVGRAPQTPHLGFVDAKLTVQLAAATLLSVTARST